jgi:ABC-type transport system involved in cytochrome bd biosynthesis fused ATPase/permease subunit
MEWIFASIDFRDQIAYVLQETVLFRGTVAENIALAGGDLALGMNLATAVFHAVADGSLVHIQPDVIHRFHGGRLLHQALLPRPMHSN